MPFIVSHEKKMTGIVISTRFMKFIRLSLLYGFLCPLLVLGCLIVGCPVGRQLGDVHVWWHHRHWSLLSKLGASVVLVPVYGESFQNMLLQSTLLAS